MPVETYDDEGNCDCDSCVQDRASEVIRQAERLAQLSPAERHLFWACDGRVMALADAGTRANESFRGFFFEGQTQGRNVPVYCHKAEFEASGHRRYVGTYFAAMKIGAQITIISDVAYDCPHCAEEASQAYGRGWVGVGGVGWVGVDDVSKMASQTLSAFQEAPNAPDMNFWQTEPNPGIEYCEQVCSQCKRYGHNSRTCSSRRFLDKIGIEIEGRWKNFDDVADVASELGANGSPDGSIRSHPMGGDYTNYEWKTKPGFLSAALNQLVKLYPDSTGADCGMHVHMSFMDRTVHCQLMTDEFYAYYLARWRAWGQAQGFHPWHHFWSRLNGLNSYCKQNPPKMNEIRNPFGDVDRYVHLNFGSWGAHKTLECRMLPMFSQSRHAVLAVTELVNIVNDYLDMQCESEAVFVAQDIVAEIAPLLRNGAISSSVIIDDKGSHDIHTVATLADLLPTAPGFQRLVRKDAVTNSVIINLLSLREAA